jgi:putative aminopeptidase FrvX
MLDEKGETMKDIFTELHHLTAIPALSGLEEKMIKEMVSRFKPLADEVEVDRIGNVTATFKGKSDQEPTMLVFAHVDELGLMIRKIERNGFLRFDRIGGVPEKTLMGQFMDVHTTDDENVIRGVVGTYAHHYTPAEAKSTVPTHKQMYIDIGAYSYDEVIAKGINIGSAVTYSRELQRVGEHMVCGKTLDNRIGCLMLIALAEYLHENPPAGTVYVVASVQEEFSIRGVMPAFTRLEPDASICIDICPASDTPDLNFSYEIALGKGPAITYMNFHGRGTLAGIIPSPPLRKYIESVLEKLAIPWQRDMALGVITDDAFTLMSGTQGVAMAHFAVPMRYSHAPIEMSDMRDIELGIKALNEMVAGFSSKIDLRRG